jgi:hypothetical protein
MALALAEENSTPMNPSTRKVIATQSAAGQHSIYLTTKKITRSGIVSLIN